MVTDYISREAFLADKKWLYCTDCDKRKGKKRGKMVTLYEIGEAPCKSCGTHDMLEDVEAYPAADVQPVVTCKECVWHVNDGCHNCTKLGMLCPDDADFYCKYGRRPNCGAKMEES